MKEVSGGTDAAFAPVYEKPLEPVRECVGGSRPIPRSDTAATLNRIIVTAPISPKKTRWRSTPNLTAGFFLRSIIVEFVLPLGQQHSSIRIAVVTPTPQLQVEEPRRPAGMMNEALEVSHTTISVEGSAILGKFYLWNYIVLEHGADVVKPPVYPFKCREWDLATARPACASNSPDDASRPVG